MEEKKMEREEKLEEVEELSELEKLEQDLAESGDKYLRLAAEYDNYRKRSLKEKQALYEQSIVDVLKAWLPVLDNLDRACQLAETAKGQEDKMKEGLELIRKQALATMASLGVEEIDCSQPFDPNLHDAIMHVEDEQYGAGEIIEVMQKGYKREDTVIRHSMVRVAN